MATKKPVSKKTPAKPAKKAVKAAKKTATKTKPVKPAAKKVPAKKTAGMAKMVVDRMPLPKGGKLYVKAAKRPTTKKKVK